ncbi:MAG TPA: MBL fold metallo-hydrolase [candidate division Zixibacteria bacterium]|nr:MBL fold metallo-hydrolase [candidate division Zixibacteria bacterium]
MELKTLVVGVFQVNCYLYWDPQTLDGVIIDPGEEAETIIEQVDKAGFKPKAILLTHGHGDHIAAVGEIKEHFDLPLYLGDGDQTLMANPSENVSALVGFPIVAPEADYILTDEQDLNIGSIHFKVLATPGHTRGGVCLLDEKANLIFTGDTLFWGSIGRTDFPGGSYGQLIDSIKRKLLKLPDNIVCYPGHGPETTIGSERVNNPFINDGGLV